MLLSVLLQALSGHADLQGAGAFTSLVQYPDLMWFSVISVLHWCTWDQAPSVSHCPGFSVGCTNSCTLHRVQTRCLVNMHFSTVSLHYLAIHLSDPGNLEVQLLQLWFSTHDTGATSQFSSGFICAAIPSPLHALAFPSVEQAPLYSHVFVKQVVVRTQRSVILSWTNLFWPRHLSRICFLGTFWCHIWGMYS